MIAVGAGVLSLVCSIVITGLWRAGPKRYELGKAGAVDKLEFKGNLRFNPFYWYVVGLCFTFYSAIFPFRTFAIDFFTNKILATRAERGLGGGPSRGLWRGPAFSTVCCRCRR